MKVHEILEEQELNELNLRQAAAAGMIGLSTLSGPAVAGQHAPHASHQRTTVASPTMSKRKELTDNIIHQHKIAPELARNIVNTAYKYAHPVFPTPEHILAVIGVESHFKPHATSGLASDPAIGLMQIRADVWNINPERLLTVEDNIKFGSTILRRYYNRLHSVSKALQAYNLGITAVRHGERRPSYVRRVHHELKQLTEK